MTYIGICRFCARVVASAPCSASDGDVSTSTARRGATRLIRSQMNAASRHETLARVWGRRGVPCLFTMLLFGQALALAQSGPRPPCGMEPDPPYSELDSPPIVKFWNESDLSRDWIPPACTGWSENGFSTLITTGARFRYAAGTEGLLRQIGAISELAGMHYWSTTHKQWQTLIVSARA